MSNFFYFIWLKNVNNILFTIYGTGLALNDWPITSPRSSGQRGWKNLLLFLQKNNKTGYIYIYI